MAMGDHVFVGSQPLCSGSGNSGRLAFSKRLCLSISNIDGLSMLYNIGCYIYIGPHQNTVTVDFRYSIRMPECQRETWQLYQPANA